MNTFGCREYALSAAPESLGILIISDALQRALEEKLDLVEVASQCRSSRLSYYGLWKVQIRKIEKTEGGKKKQHVSHLKEIKMHPKIEEHDYGFKLDHAEVPHERDRVKATIVFRAAKSLTSISEKSSSIVSVPIWRTYPILSFRAKWKAEHDFDVRRRQNENQGNNTETGPGKKTAGSHGKTSRPAPVAAPAPEKEKTQ